MQTHIEEIKIILKTNIPESPEIEFDRTILYHEDKSMFRGFNKYPYFTHYIDYDYSKLINKPYSERVEFFFKKKSMEKLIIEQKKKEKKNNPLNSIDDDNYIVATKTPSNRKNGYMADINESDIDKLKENIYKDNEKEKELSKRIKNNILIMLRLLFPTHFPVINDIQQSTDIILNGSSSFNNMFIDPYSFFMKNESYYSYFNIKNRLYTTQKVVWINDFLNHPLYNKLLLTYIQISNTINSLYKKEKNYLINKLIANKNNETERIEYNFKLTILKLLYKHIFVSNSRTSILKHHIIKEYLNDDTIDIDNDKDGDSIPNKLNKRIEKLFNEKNIRSMIDEYKKIISELSNYLYPHTTSVNPVLQRYLIQDNNEDIEPFFSFLKFLHSKYIKNEKVSVFEDLYEELMDVNVCITNSKKKEPMYQMYIAVDFIEGKLDNSNISDFKCMFKDKILANKLSGLLEKRKNSWNLLEHKYILSVEDPSNENRDTKEYDNNDGIADNINDMSRHNNDRENDNDRRDNTDKGDKKKEIIMLDKNKIERINDFFYKIIEKYNDKVKMNPDYVDKNKDELNNLLKNEYNKIIENTNNYDTTFFAFLNEKKKEEYIDTLNEFYLFTENYDKYRKTIKDDIDKKIASLKKKMDLYNKKEAILNTNIMSNNRDIEIIIKERDKEKEVIKLKNKNVIYKILVCYIRIINDMLKNLFDELIKLKNSGGRRTTRRNRIHYNTTKKKF